MNAATAVKDPDALANELSDLIATESRGLMRHVAGTNAFVDKKTYRLRQAIERIADHTSSHVQRITAVMEDLELSPSARTYPMEVSFHHYDSIQSMQQLLLEEKRNQIAAYERAIQHVGPAPEARAELEALLADNRSHLDQLQNAF